MSLLAILMLSGLVRVFSQSTLLDSQCDGDGDCRNDVEIHRLVAMMDNMERNIFQKMKMVLKTELDSQKTSIYTELSNLNSQLSDQEKKFETIIQELDQTVKNQKDTIYQLQTKVLELASKVQTANVESSTTSGLGSTPNVIESTTRVDCEDIQALGYQISGVYGVNAGNGQTKRVYCEMSPDGRPWTRILHRQDNLTDFTNKTWVEFGDPLGSYWTGLILMNQLTTRRDYKLRVDLMDWEGATRYAQYSTFLVGRSSDKYRLNIDGYSGTAGDSMKSHDNMMFTTIDQDNDPMTVDHCAKGTGQYTGGWWYNNCFKARLTGPYLVGGDVPKWYGIVWPSWRGVRYSYKVATMKVQRL